MVVTEADLQRIREDLAALDKLETAEELEHFLDTRANPLKEMRRRDGGVGERRAWPRTPWIRDLLIVLRPVLLVTGVALILLGMFGAALLEGWIL